MAQDKRVFIGGMDKDSDPRLIKDGDYRDALNIRNIASMDGTSGSVENIEGNTLVPFTFIDEIDQTLEFTASSGGQIVIEEVPVEQVFRSQQIILTGKEEYNVPVNFFMYYQTVTVNSDGSVTLNEPGTIQQGVIVEQPDPSVGSVSVPLGAAPVGINFIGNIDATKTIEIILQVFGPSGPWSLLNVQDYTTGEMIQIQVESIVNNAGNPVVEGMSMNANYPITITYTSLTPNTYFHLNFTSEFSQVTDQLWSETITSQNPNGGLWISESSQMVIGSELGFSTMDPETDGVNFNVDDEDTVYSGGLPISTTGATWDLDIIGTEPTNPTTVPDEDNNVNIYTWDDLGGGNINVLEFIPMTDKVPQTSSGGLFPFDTNQHQFSNLLTDIVKQPSDVGPVIVTGGGGLVSVPSNISTNFLPSTPMTGRNRSLERNTAPDQKRYNQIEYYYNSDEVVEAPGFTINEGVLTFSGEDIVAGEFYLLKAPIVKGRAHKLTFDVSGMPAGNSFSFEILNVDFPGADKDGSFESFFTSRVDYAYIYIKFKNNFSATDSMTITNLRLLLERVELGQLTLRFQTSLGIDFNLGFATSEEALRDSIKSGKDVTVLPSWYPGTAMRLTKRTVGDQDNVDVVDSFEFQDLQEQLTEALNNVNELNSEIDTLTNNHATEIEILTTQANTDATAATNALNNANATIAALQSDKDEISQSLTNLENIIIEIDDEDSEANIITLINEYDTNKGDVVQSLTNIVTNLSAIDTELIANTELHAQVLDLTNKLEEAENLIALQQATIFDKDQQIINLANQVSDLQDKVSEANSEITRLKAEVQELTNKLSIAQSQIDNLKIINEQLNLLIASGELVIQANQDTIIDLKRRLEQALQLIDSQEGTIEDQGGQILSLNDIIDDARDKIEFLESQLAAQQSESESNTQELQNEINDLTEINNKLQDKLDLANQQIETLQVTIASNAQYTVTLAEFNNLKDKYSDLASEFEDLEFNYEALLQQFNQSQANVDDGITQADVNAAFEAGVASVDVSNIISEHEQLNGNVISEELLNNSDFKDPVNQWVADDWVFQNGLAISDSKLSNLSRGLNQSVNLKAGRYFLNLNIHELKNCSLEVLFVSQRDNKVVAKTKIDSDIKGAELIDITQDCDVITILVHKRKDKEHFVSIDKISLTKFVNNGSVTAKLILELLAYINQVDARNQNLQKTVLEQESIIEGLQNELEQAKKDIVEYVLLLGNANNNILTLADVIIDVVSDLGISATATAEDVVNLTNTFNSDQFNLNEAISSQSNLVSSLTSLLNEVDGGSTSSNPNNEKWLLTISGGLPIVTSSALFLYNTVGNQSLIIKNPNIPDLNPTTSAPSSLGNFLENPGFIIVHAFSDNFSYRDGDYLSGGIHQDKDPEYIVVSDLNNISNRVNYDANLERWIDGEFYDGNPNTFYTTFYSPQAEKSFTIKFTLLNVNPRLAVVNANGEPWNGSGDKILGNRGNQRPIVTSTSYLENLGVTDGLQIEIEFLGGETGWELYKYKSTLGTLEKINSQQSVPLIVDNTKTWSFNLSNPSDPDYILPGGANTILHIEKIQEAPSSSSRIASDGVESFVNALTLPSYNGQNLNSNSYMNPSSSSDIIMNKSRDIEPDLSAHVLGAKRVSKNKI